MSVDGSSFRLPLLGRFAEKDEFRELFGKKAFADPGGTGKEQRVADRIFSQHAQEIALDRVIADDLRKSHYNLNFFAIVLRGLVENDSRSERSVDDANALAAGFRRICESPRGHGRGIRSARIRFSSPEANSSETVRARFRPIFGSTSRISERSG